MKHFYTLFLCIVLLIVSVIALVFVNKKNEYPKKHLEVVLRNIGHQLLLQSKDSTSRVLSITTINQYVYRISFENSFSFTPDTLMNVIQQQLKRTTMPQDYIVSVDECDNNKTIFSYEINSLNGNIKPCGARKQDIGCYLIQIEFLDNKPFNYASLLIAFIPIAFVGFYFNRKKKKKKLNEVNIKEENSSKEELISIENKTVRESLYYKKLGSFRFFEFKGVLSLNDERIELSEKEIKALSIFMSNQNLVVERAKLRKEIWEDQGVFVNDRSVDVLVSKLRKKLIHDPSIKILKVQGKGYKLVF